MFLAHQFVGQQDKKLLEKLLCSCHETWWEGVVWAKEEPIKYRSRDTQIIFCFY